MNKKFEGRCYTTPRLFKGMMKRIGDDILLTPITYLTKKERKLIVRTWIEVKDRIEFVQSIYLEIFQRYPQIQDQFREFRLVPDHRLKEEPTFRDQCIAYGNFLDYIVGFVHLNSGNFIEDACSQLGRAHGKIQIQNDWWCAFSRATISNLKPYFGRERRIPGFLRKLMIGSYERAWTILLERIQEYTRSGFEEIRREQEPAVEEETVKPSSDLIKWLETTDFTSGRGSSSQGSMWSEESEDSSRG